jgi:hypothetical protein
MWNLSEFVKTDYDAVERENLAAALRWDWYKFVTSPDGGERYVACLIFYSEKQACYLLLPAPATSITTHRFLAGKMSFSDYVKSQDHAFIVELEEGPVMLRSTKVKASDVPADYIARFKPFQVRKTA